MNIKDKLLINYEKNLGSFYVTYAPVCTLGNPKDNYYFHFPYKEFGIFIEFLKDVLSNKQAGTKIIIIRSVMSHGKKTNTHTTVVVLNIKNTGYE